MPETIRPDICVIGTGPGSLPLAMQAVALGVAVVLVDNEVADGELADRAANPAPDGCRLPLSALAAAARRASLVAQSPAFGVQVKSLRIDFQHVQEHVQGAIGARALNRTRERLAGLGVRVVEGVARFKDASTLVVAAGIEIAARSFVIATGSSPALPPIPGLERAPCLTTETVFGLATCPEQLIVIGASPIGLEFAQAFRRLGAEVTIVADGVPLPGEDPECAAVVLDQLAREGIAIRSGQVTRVAASVGQVQAMVAGPGGEQPIPGSHLLVVGGRWPHVVGLGLDAAGIKFDEHGIAVDRSFRTANRRVYAIGDVTGRETSDHMAEQQAGLVVRHALARQPVRFDPETAPRVIFTDPEMAQTGLTEAAARSRGHKVRVLRWPYRENDRAHAEGQVRGHIKVVLGGQGRILGATIVGAGAGELITTWTLAIASRTDIQAMSGIIIPYPTLAEIGKRAAATYFMVGSAGSRGRRFGWLRR
jgi:pyruvate/2-oxoglutarate dehydrogenase complex dihydrolipoamide dehydrogenase (E3) component